MNIKLQLYILLLTLLTSCLKQPISKPNQSIFLFKDGDGLYIYEPVNKKEKIICKLHPDQIFYDEPCVLKNDTLTFVLKGKNPLVTGSSKDYFSIDMNTRERWLSKQVIYEEIGNKIKIKTFSIDKTGKSAFISDTSIVFQESEGSYKGVTYNLPRFYSKHSLGNKTIFSDEGSIYQIINTDTTILLKYDDQFDPKFGSGYLQPQISPTLDYAICIYVPAFLSFLKRTSLQIIDLKSKETKVLKYGEFYTPKFSSDGKFILFTRNYKFEKGKMSKSDIYILEIETLNEEKIGNAYSAQWN